jgi:uncharacterized peroxidase-related enzyme
VSWIRSIGERDASGALAPLYGSIRAASNSGRVSNLWQTCGLDPRGLSAMFAHYQELMADPAPLTATQAEFIALAVSAVNGCAYCVAHHGPRAARACGDEPLARAVARDYREADLPARDRVLLDAAIALTCEPAERKAEDIERLREYGFGDEAILKATEITAFYNLVNRVVSALGVSLEDGLEPWEYGGTA